MAAAEACLHGVHPHRVHGGLERAAQQGKEAPTWTLLLLLLTLLLLTLAQRLARSLPSSALLLVVGNVHAGN